MRRAFFLAAMCAATSVFTPAASAQETGLDALHEQRREGNKICMVSHYHYGSSANQPNRKAAEAAAIKDWVGFTAWEYGDPWGSWALAGSKKVECTASGASHGCTVEARACKPVARGGKKK
jgi:hypothetical protein